MNSTLIPERPLLISPTLAATIGLDEAVLLHVLSELIAMQPGASSGDGKWIEDILSTGDIELKTSLTKKIAGRKIKEFSCDLKISQDGAFDISINFDEAKIKILCQNDLE